jgi:hypothetical protein
MKRWVPFAIAVFMLTPFALWAGLALVLPGGDLSGVPTGAGGVLLLASLPLAGLFFVQNIRQLGDAMGAPSRFDMAGRLAAILPLLVLLAGGLGTAWLIAGGGGFLEPAIGLAGTLVMAAVSRLAARAPVEPGQVVATAGMSPAAEDAAARQALLAIGNVAMALVLLAFYWTPWVLFWAAMALIPVAFVAMMALAWWAATSEVVERRAPPRPGRPANDRGYRPAQAA